LTHSGTSRRTRVLAIGGSDPSGGGGIQADQRAIHALGGWAFTVVTSVTVQNSRGLLGAQPVEPRIVAEQIRALAGDFSIAAVKTGMLASSAIVRAVVAELTREPLSRLPLVVDPVLSASAGGVLLDDEGLDLLLETLLPLAALCTPNRPEAERMAGIPVRTLEDAREAAGRLLARGPRAVLVKGGHGSGAEVVDLLLDAGGTRCLSSPRIPGPAPRGTGCTLAAAIAHGLGAGLALEEAVLRARELVAAAMRAARPLGRGAPVLDAGLRPGGDDGEEDRA